MAGGRETSIYTHSLVLPSSLILRMDEKTTGVVKRCSHLQAKSRGHRMQVTLLWPLPWMSCSRTEKDFSHFKGIQPALHHGDASRLTQTPPSCASELSTYSGENSEGIPEIYTSC